MSSNTEISNERDFCNKNEVANRVVDFCTACTRLSTGTSSDAGGQLCRTCTGASTGIARGARGHRKLTTDIVTTNLHYSGRRNSKKLALTACPRYF